MLVEAKPEARQPMQWGEIEIEEESLHFSEQGC